jgi:hypothetical protein
MLAFDIETTGLDGRTCVVTAACVHGVDMHNSPVSETFLFPNEDPGTDLLSRQAFLRHLDSSPRLCAFNGVRFDIPFLHSAWRLPDSQVEGWALKTFDVFEASKLALNSTFSLDKLLNLNRLESKTGSGLHAIHLAKTHQWKELGDYCMQDTRMTYIVSSQPIISLPVSLQGRPGLALVCSNACPFVQSVPLERGGMLLKTKDYAGRWPP